MKGKERQEYLEGFFEKDGKELNLNNFLNEDLVKGYLKTLERIHSEGYSTFSAKFKDVSSKERDFINLKLEERFKELKEMGAKININFENREILLILAKEDIKNDEIKAKIKLLGSEMYYLMDIDREKFYLYSNCDKLKKTIKLKIDGLYGEKGKLPREEYAKKLLSVIDEYFEYNKENC